MKTNLKIEIDLGRFIGKKTYNLVNDKTEVKIRSVFNNYFNKYPLLKINNDKKMKFEIGNKKEFAKMISNLWGTMQDSLPSIAKPIFKTLPVYKKANNILSDINKSLPNLDANDYKSIVFSYI
jgi:hypothetical protein